MAERATLEKYREQSLHYLDNAFRHLATGDAAKSGEFFWGSTAEAFKALAASKGIFLRTHRDVWNYAIAAAKELDDESLHQAFTEANALHSNFYEVELEVTDVSISAERGRQAVARILGLLPG